MTTASTSTKDLQEPTSPFSQWLIRQVGPCKWVIARSSKKRRKEGYDKFFTQRQFTALKHAFERETAPMSEIDHLTEPNPDLAAKRSKTMPGMAFWAGTGPEGKTCRECKHWAFDGYLASSGLLKDAQCDKYTRMMNGNPGGKLPHYMPACKYFELDSTAPSIEKRRGSA